MATLALNIDPSGAIEGGRKAEAALDGVKRKAKPTADAVEKVGDKTKTAGNQANDAAGGINNGAEALGELAVKCARSERPLGHLLKTLPRLRGAMSMLAGVAAAGLGIALAFVSEKIIDMVMDSETLTDAVDDLGDALNSMNKIAGVTASDGLEAIRKKYGEINEEILTLIKNQQGLANLELTKALDKLDEKLAAMSDPNAFKDVWNSLTARGGDAAIRSLINSLDIRQAAATRLADALSEYDRALGAEAKADALSRVNTILREISQANLGNVSDDFAEFWQATQKAEPELRATLEVQRQLRDLIGETNNELDGFGQLSHAAGVSWRETNMAIDAISAVISEARNATAETADEAETLAAKLDDAVRAANDLKAPFPALQRMLDGLVGSAASLANNLRNAAAFARATAAAQANADARSDAAANQISEVPYGGGGPMIAQPLTQGQIQSAIDNLPSPGGGGGGSAVDTLSEQLDKLRLKYDDAYSSAQELAYAQDVLGRAFEAGMISVEEYSHMLQLVQDEMDNTTQASEQLQQIGDAIGSAFEDAFMAIISGSEDMGETVKKIIRQLVLELFRVLVLQQLIKGITGLINGTGHGGAFPGLPGAASGAVVDAGDTHIVGEEGKEIFLPLRTNELKSGADGLNWIGANGPEVFTPKEPGIIVPADMSRKIAGMRAGGGDVMPFRSYIGGEFGPELFIPARATANNNQRPTISVVQHNTFGDGVSRADLVAAMPKIVETTKRAVFDAQRRTVNGRGF